jgi:hypothetical protein
VLGAGSLGRLRSAVRPQRFLVAATGLTTVVVVAVALGVQASRGNAVVSVQSSPTAELQARVDDAFYACLATQAHSVVGPGQTVALDPRNIVDLVTLMKAVGSWVPVADPPSSAVVSLSIRNGPGGPGTCLGTRIIGRVRGPGGIVLTRLGTGAQVPGQGPPPAPPL